MISVKDDDPSGRYTKCVPETALNKKCDASKKFF